jgi:hypothetical protein
MKLTSVRSIVCPLALIVSLPVMGEVRAAVCVADDPQEQVKVRTVKEGDVFHIPEPGALVIKKMDDLSIQFVAPAGDRRDPYKGIDLQTGDVILMANGKRVKTIK